MRTIRRALPLLAILASSVFFLAATPASSPAAASCHLSMSPGNIGPGHPGGQITFDSCTDVDKIEVDYGASLNGFSMSVLQGTTGYFVIADRYAGINACGTNGYQTVPAGGLAFICHGSSGTICGTATSGCSMWGYRSDFNLGCSASLVSLGISYKLHRWSTNGWQTPQGPASPFTQVC